MRREKKHLRTSLALAVLGVAVFVAGPTRAAFVWDGESNTNWWFDAVNWNTNNNDNTDLPSNPSTATATEIDNGWNSAGDGVVFDPAHDPNANGATTAAIENLYLGNDGTQSVNNKLTVKSGTLSMNTNTGSTSNGYSILARNTTNQTATIVQAGGNVLFTNAASSRLSLANASGSTGIYEYHGGNLEVAALSGAGSSTGIRLGGDSSSLSGSVTGQFVVYNDGPAGHIHVSNFLMGYATNSGGVTTGQVIFHDSNGVRPVQIDNRLSLRNSSSQASELDVVLDSAPTLSGADSIDGSHYQPANISLFALGPSGSYTGVSTNPKLFQLISGGSLTDLTTTDNYFHQGDLVEASYGGNSYEWTISYQGVTTFSDASTSAISSIAGTGGQDVVLIGYTSSVPTAVPEPAALGLLAISGLTLLRRRK